MKEKAQGAWLTLNTSYYPAVVDNPLLLLDDAHEILEHAHGVVAVIREALCQTPLDDDSLIHALRAVELLMAMSAGCAEAAHVRFEQIGDAWIGSRG